MKAKLWKWTAINKKMKENWIQYNKTKKVKSGVKNIPNFEDAYRKLCKPLQKE